MTQRVAFITGGTGAVGPALVRHLVAEGWRVRVLARREVTPGVFPAGVTCVRGDLSDRAALSDGMTGASAVFHFAAMLHVVDPRPELIAEFERVNVAGTRSLVEAALRAGVPRVVLASTVAVYGAVSGTIDERTPPAATTAYGRTKLEAEACVLEAVNASGEPLGVVLRLGAVFGPGLKGNYLRLVRSIARGRFVAIGNGANRRALIYDADLARIAERAALVPEAAGRVLNVTDGDSHTMRSIIAEIHAATGRVNRGFSLPLWPIRAGLRACDVVSRLSGLRIPYSVATLEKYTEDLYVDSRLWRDVLGPVRLTPFDAAWRETVEGMRQQGLL